MNVGVGEPITNESISHAGFAKVSRSVSWLLAHTFQKNPRVTRIFRGSSFENVFRTCWNFILLVQWCLFLEGWQESESEMSSSSPQNVVHNPEV